MRFRFLIRLFTGGAVILDRHIHMMNNCLIACVLLLSINTYAAPWHLEAWQARAVVEISRTVGSDVQTAAVKVMCQGRGQADGRDYRVLDRNGEMVPFELTFHDAAHYSLIAFRAAAAAAGQRYFVYFDNPDAQQDTRKVVRDPTPGSGAPTGNWTPRSGFVFSTIQRPEGANPETVEELRTMVAASTEKYGAQYQRRIADSRNPFGSSNYYISEYRGWIDIPHAGVYAFCTASNEASFSFIDGKDLAHWPGRHAAEKGMRGEFSKAIDLTAGRHYLEYYHEEVLLKQLAFLGWCPPGTRKGQFLPIPESLYTVPHAAAVTRYESPTSALLHFEPTIIDSIWPQQRSEGQYTRVRFEVGHPGAFPDGTTFHWAFGDGHTTTGASVQHVFTSLGHYNIQLSTGDAKVSWLLPVYEIQDVSDEITQGRPSEYAAIVETYDPNQLQPQALSEMAHLFAESERPRDARRVGRIFVDRFADSHSETAARINRLIALCALELGNEGIDDAIAAFQASILVETPAAERIDSIAQLIWLLGVKRGQPETTEALLRQIEAIAQSSVVDDQVRAAYRRAINAAGDTAIWHGDRTTARGFYKRVELLRGHHIPSQVRAARIGAYPNAIREFLASGNYGAALEIVNEWEEKFASDKIKGHTFFWRGTILARRQQHQDAARYLARAIGLATGASFEPEARWQLAMALEQLGRHKDAQVELAKLLAIGMNDEFTDMAREKLKEQQ